MQFSSGHTLLMETHTNYAFIQSGLWYSLYLHKILIQSRIIWWLTGTVPSIEYLVKATVMPSGNKNNSVGFN